MYVALNNLQWLICHKNKTKRNETKPKTKLHLVTFHESILVSLLIFRPLSINFHYNYNQYGDGLEL